MPQIARLVPPSVPVDVYMLLHSYIGRSVFSLFGVVPFRTLLDHRTTPHPKPPRTFRVRAENPAPPRMKPTPRTPRDAAPRVTPRLGAALHWTALVLGDLIQRPRRAEAGRAVSGQRFGDRSCRCLGNTRAETGLRAVRAWTNDGDPCFMGGSFSPPPCTMLVMPLFSLI